MAASQTISLLIFELGSCFYFWSVPYPALLQLFPLDGGNANKFIVSIYKQFGSPFLTHVSCTYDSCTRRARVHNCIIGSEILKSMVLGNHSPSKKKAVICTLIMASTTALLTLLISLSLVYGLHDNSQQTTFQPIGWEPDGFRSLVTFGDSYTDEARAWYFNDHGGAAPPTGWVGSVVSHDLQFKDNLPSIKPHSFFNSRC